MHAWLKNFDLALFCHSALGIIYIPPPSSRFLRKAVRDSSSFFLSFLGGRGGEGGGGGGRGEEESVRC